MYLNLIFAAKICFFVKQTDFCTVVNYDEMRGACGKREKKQNLYLPHFLLEEFVCQLIYLLILVSV